jgi:hypothetical protein
MLFCMLGSTFVSVLIFPLLLCASSKEVVCSPVDTHLADACVLTKCRKCLFIPTKPYECISRLWFLGNVHTAKPFVGGERVPDALKWGPVS